MFMNKVLRDLYIEMLAEHGHQHWWPAETPYEVLVGAILTQNTNWKNVEMAIAKLKKVGSLSPYRILGMHNRKLEKLIRSSGYYKQKAERLKAATKKWLALRNSKADTMWLREEWLSVKGIGKETADSILLYAFKRPIFVVDAYTKLFCSHHGLFEGMEYDQYRSFFESHLPSSVPLFKEYHALIVEWAKGQKRKAIIRKTEIKHRLADLAQVDTKSTSP